jgi:dienelactone hydrolase
MRRIIPAALCAVFCLAHAHAQTVHLFREGLASGRAHSYGREAVITDTLLDAMTRPGFQPTAGVAWYDQGGVVKRWVPVQGDSTGRFRHEAMSNGYLWLTYESPRPRTALLTVTGNAMVYVNGEPRAGDPYASGWLRLPVQLHKGRNSFLVRTGFNGRFSGVQVSLEFGGPAVRLDGGDATLPFLVRGVSADSLLAGIVCLNTTGRPLKGLRIEATTGSRSLISSLPEVPALTVRKLPVSLPLPDGDGTGPVAYRLLLRQGTQVLDTLSISIPRVGPEAHASHTFTSGIDGSVQYYAVAPQQGGPRPGSSLYLSVHGAGVEAIGQARAYVPKSDGTLVAPTNRRPRGFNWEDWGRLDALEVLDIATRTYRPDPSRVYLTGHSMGGHGTWFLGATYAGRWAAIAPCAGYPVLQAYGSADGRIPTESANPLHRMLLRASHPSNVLELARNYRSAGVYVFHGDDDRTVPVEFARQMRGVLAGFHPDFAYYEYPGGSHWFGNESVDWPPLFSYLQAHRNREDDAIQEIDFTTASPAISSAHRWVRLLQQERTLDYSRVRLRRDTSRGTIRGTTENLKAIAIDPGPFRPGSRLTVELDSSRIPVTVSADPSPLVFVRTPGGWRQGPAPAIGEKGERRGAGFKDAFRDRFLLVYGTAGNAEENAWAAAKARYDAETWYYRGNGALDVIPDTRYDSVLHAGRGVVLYGNAHTNSAYGPLMRGCPVVIGRGKASVGGREWSGGDIGACFLWPGQGDDRTCVAVVGGTGPAGMRAAESNQYFAGGSGFPDILLFRSSMLTRGPEALVAAGFYHNDWTVGDDIVFR